MIAAIAIMVERIIYNPYESHPVNNVDITIISGSAYKSRGGYIDHFAVEDKSGHFGADGKIKHYMFVDRCPHCDQLRCP